MQKKNLDKCRKPTNKYRKRDVSKSKNALLISKNPIIHKICFGDLNKSEIENTILEEIAKTKKSIVDYKGLTQAISPDDAIGRVSRMDAINNKSVNEASLRQAEQKLNNLNRVLEKLNDRDFGKCLKCKQPIPVGRIMIRPESLLCVNCAR